MSGMNLNLLPSRAKFQAIKIKYQNHNRRAMIALVGAWVATVAVVLMLNLYAGIVQKAAAAKLEQTEKNYAGLADNVVVSQRLKYKAKMVGGVLDERFEYGQAFETIQKLFPPTITLNNYQLKNKNSFEISGKTIGRQNVDYLERLVMDINSGRDMLLKTAKITGLSLSGIEWDFTMEVELK